jgi:tetratricopeptide (TPR) repeat protein
LSGNTSRAIAEYENSIMLNPSYLIPHKNLAAIKAQTGDLAGAIREYDFIIGSDAEDNVSWYYRGLAYFNLGNRQHACADWATAKQLGSKNAAEKLNSYCH